MIDNGPGGIIHKIVSDSLSTLITIEDLTIGNTYGIIYAYRNAIYDSIISQVKNLTSLKYSLLH